MSNNDHFLKIKLIKNENSIMAQLNQFHNFTISQFQFQFQWSKILRVKKKRERQKERQRKTERERQHFINASYITRQFSFIITLFA